MSVSIIVTFIFVFFLVLILLGLFRLFLKFRQNRKRYMQEYKRVSVPERPQTHQISSLSGMTGPLTRQTPPGTTPSIREPDFVAANNRTGQGRPAYERKTTMDITSESKRPERLSIISPVASPNDFSRPYYKPKE